MRHVGLGVPAQVPLSGGYMWLMTLKHSQAEKLPLHSRPLWQCHL